MDDGKWMQEKLVLGEELAHERLEVYRLALELALVVGEAVAQMPRGRGRLGAQLIDAASSVPSNIAEGCGRASARDQAHFFRIAKGSAGEISARLDVLRLYAWARPHTCARGRALVVRVVQMLSKLAARAAQAAPTA